MNPIPVTKTSVFAIPFHMKSRCNDPTFLGTSGCAFPMLALDTRAFFHLRFSFLVIITGYLLSMLPVALGHYSLAQAIGEVKRFSLTKRLSEPKINLLITP